MTALGRPRTRWLARAVAVTLAWLPLELARSAEPPSAADYASVSPWPDWSGWWAMESPLSDEWQRNPPPLRVGYRAFLEARATDSDPDPRRYCRPFQFTGITGDFVAAIEFLYSPQRVTIAGEDGSLRRIYLASEASTAPTESTNTGTSIGHWEGSTLVVETTAISPTALYPGRRAGSQPVGQGVRIVERITRIDVDTIVFDVTTTAPEVLTAPDRRVRTYRRVAKPRADEISLCVEHDRSIDPVTGKQRFDLTPPADLPPPPPRS